jgi:hypothetical protein
VTLTGFETLPTAHTPQISAPQKVAAALERLIH